MSDLTRDDLLSICDRAFVPESAWRDRDSASAQRQVGEAYALLRAGCDFEFCNDMGGDVNRTIWVRILSRGFAWFDWDGDLDDETFYLPTEKRLAEASGRDWY